MALDRIRWAGMAAAPGPRGIGRRDADAGSPIGLTHIGEADGAAASPPPSRPYDEFAMTKVLVVDDEPAIVRLVRDYLERASFEVMTASNGEDALQHFTRNRPDLVILDLSLPVWTGSMLLERCGVPAMCPSSC